MAINVIMDTFVVNENEIECIIVINKNESLPGNKVWCKATDVAEFLGYDNTKQAIEMHVQDINKETWANLSITHPSNKVVSLQHATIFINKAGIDELVLHSKKPYDQLNEFEQAKARANKAEKILLLYQQYYKAQYFL